MFFIYDCNNKIVGNINGYKTVESASKQTKTINSKAYKQIYDAFYNAPKSNTRICKICNKI